MIIVRPAADSEDGREAIRQALVDLRERHYLGCDEYDSPHHGVVEGLMVETPQHYHAGRRTLNHVLARAAREGRIFTRDPGAEDSYRHDGDVSNEWEMVTLERLRRASSDALDLGHLRGYWLDRAGRSLALNALPGRNAHGLLWNSGAALLSILGVIYPRDSVAEMAAAIARHDAGWSHEFQSVKGGEKGVLKKSRLKPLAVRCWATMPGQSIVAEGADDRTAGPVPQGLHSVPVHQQTVAGLHRPQPSVDPD